MDALKSYAYRGVDHSFVSNYIMQPYWSRLVHLFPRWMAYAGVPTTSTSKPQAYTRITPRSAW